MKDDGHGNERPFTFEGAYGRLLRPMHSERDVRCFTIQETEMEMLSAADNKASSFFSFGSFFMAAAVSVYLGWAFSGPLNEVGKALAYVVGPLLVTFSLSMFVLGYLERRTKKSLIDRIKRESRPITGKES